jgi:peptidoglycan hydrolase CwlO-like protein
LCRSSKLILLVLFALFLDLPAACFADYIMTDKEREESLQIITSLKQDLMNRQVQYEALETSNKLTEEQLRNLEKTVTSLTQHITDLENSVNQKEILLAQLNQEKESIQNDLIGLKNSLEECEKKIKRLVWERNGAAIWAVIVTIVALF